MSVKISELPVLDSLADNDVLAGVDTSANTTAKVTLGSLKQYIDTNTQYTAGTNIDITNNVVSAPNVYNKTETNNLLNTKENTSNKVTSITSSSTNAQYPSAKSVYDHVSGVKNDILDDVEEVTSTLQEENEALKEELESVSTIFNAFPTESGEGESLTLDDTAEVKFKKFDLKGNTSQETMSGKNKIKINNTTQTISGVTFTQQSDGSIKVNGTATENITYASTTYQSVQASTQYRLSGCPSGGSTSTYSLQVLFGETTPSGQVFSDTGSGYTVTTGSDVAYVLVRISIKNGTTVSNLVFYPQLELGNSTTSYEAYIGGIPAPNPDYPIPVNVVSGDNEIVVNGKNLLKLNDKVQTTTNGITYSSQNGVISLNGTATSGVLIDFDTFVLPAGTYKMSRNDTGTISGNWQNYIRNSSGNLAQGLGTFTINESQEVFFRTYLNSGVVATNYVMKPMIEKGSSASEYEPYQGNTYNIDLPVENLFDKDNAILKSGYILNDSGSEISDASYGYFTSLMSVKPNTNYKLSANDVFVPSGQNLRFYFYDSSRNFISRTTGQGSSKEYSVITPNNCFYISFQMYSSLYTILKDSIIFANGSAIGTPIELCKIGNYQDYFGKSDGRNLYKVEDIATTTKNGVTYSVENEVITLNGAVSSGFDIDLSSYYSLEAGTYTISCQVISGSYTGTIGKYVRKPSGGGYAILIDGGSLTATRTITVSESNENSYSALYLVGGAVCNNLKVSIQLEKSSSATEWQPYGVGKWYLHKEIGKVALNGTENNISGWSSFTNKLGIKISDVLNLINISSSATNNVLISNYFEKATSQNILYSNDIEGIATTDGNIYIKIDKTTASTSTEFKTWLSSHNTDVYYVLATPTNTEITYQPLIDQLNLLEQAQSKENQTNISQVNNDLPFIIKAEAILSLKNVLDRVTLLES